MTPDRKITIGGSRVEEFYWAGRMVVYVDNQLSDETFDQVVKRLVAKQVEADAANQAA